MSRKKSKRIRQLSVEGYEHLEFIRKLDRADISDLELASQTVKDFPLGKDSFIGRHWITNAIDCASFETVKWMIHKGVELNFRDDEGYTPVHSCIERKTADKYKILKLLLQSGADVNAHGTSDWTPLHQAAIRDDQEAMLMLLEAGADLNIRTRIDDYATPEEEARRSGHQRSAEFLASFD